VSAQWTWRALDETGEARTAANRPAFPLKLPRWSCNLRQRAYNCRDFGSKKEIPAEDQSRLLSANPDGYAITSYTGQRQTADRVLIHVDRNLPARDLITNRMAYVTGCSLSVSLRWGHGAVNESETGMIS